MFPAQDNGERMFPPGTDESIDLSIDFRNVLETAGFTAGTGREMIARQRAAFARELYTAVSDATAYAALHNTGGNQP
jgi:hypothetical protein